MKLNCSNYQVLSWNEYILKNLQNPSLPFLLARNDIVRFQKDNEEVIKAAVEGHQRVIQDHFELDEQGKIIQEPVFKEESVVTRKGNLFLKELTETQKIPNGQEPKLKLGRTMEGYEDAMQKFMAQQVEVNLRPRTFTRFPITI